MLRRFSIPGITPEPLRGEPLETVREELGPFGRRLATRYFEGVRFPLEAEATFTRLHREGFVVHVMRTSAWINYLYLAWALVKRGLPPIRAVVGLRRWFTRPWSNTAQRGDFEVRFTYARRHSGSGLLFLKETALGSARGRTSRDDPFPALVAMARKSDRPVFLVPELFVWEKWNQRLKPGVVDFIFGSPEAPGFLHTLLAFWRNYHRAQFRVGEPIDLRQFIEQNPNDPDERIARKVRSALHHHLARETRMVFRPPSKPTPRLLEEVMRDRSLRKSLEELAVETSRAPEAVQRQARRDLTSIASRLNPTVAALTVPVMRWVFSRMYEGLEIDEAGFERAMATARRAPIVLVPSHKSHIDYLVMSYVLWNRGYSIPLVAAGANLSFWPLGPFLRRVGAFFLRRSFKGDPGYTAVFKAYVKKLVHDGVLQEFFPEGGRSRTGKLLAPKLGMITWEVEAILDGVRNDLIFIPVAIDYEKVVESSAHSRELSGGEKRPEDLKGLLQTPKVLASNYGRIHLGFEEPISLAEFAYARGVSLRAISEEEKKSLVRALGHRIMFGIARASTLTPQALVASALLAHRRRGITSREVTERINLLRQVADEEQARLSPVLRNAPSDPTVLGPVQDAMRIFCSDGMVKVAEVRDQVIYHPEDSRRAEMSFYKNTLLNLLAPRSLVANAVLASPGGSTLEEAKEKALFLSRLFKFEFIYRVGVTFDELFLASLERLERIGLVVRQGDRVKVAPEPHSQPQLEFFCDLLQDYLESYLIAALTLGELANSSTWEKKDFVKAALETGQAEFLAGRLESAESLSRPSIENALLYLVDQGLLVEKDRKLLPGPKSSEAPLLVKQLKAYLRSGS